MVRRHGKLMKMPKITHADFQWVYDNVHKPILEMDETVPIVSNGETHSSTTLNPEDMDGIELQRRPEISNDEMLEIERKRRFAIVFAKLLEEDI